MYKRKHKRRQLMFIGSQAQKKQMSSSIKKLNTEKEA